MKRGDLIISESEKMKIERKNYIPLKGHPWRKFVFGKKAENFAFLLPAKDVRNILELLL